MPTDLRPLSFAFCLVWVGEDIRLNLICIGQAIGAVKHIDHGDKFSHALIVQSEPLHGGAVGINSVSAVVGDGYRQGDDLLGQGIEFAGLHHGL